MHRPPVAAGAGAAGAAGDAAPARGAPPACAWACPWAAGRAAADAACVGLGGVGQREQLGIGLAVGQRLPAAATSRIGLVKHDRAFELAFVLGEVGLGLGVEVDDRGYQRAVGAGRPRLGEADQAGCTGAR